MYSIFMKKIAISSLLLLLAGCGSASPSAEQSPPSSDTFAEFPYCQPINDSWPTQTLVTGALTGDQRYAFEVCLLGTDAPVWPDAPSGQPVRVTGGKGFARLRDRETGKVLHEKPFEKLDMNLSGVFVSVDNTVWYMNNEQKIGFPPTGKDPEPSDAY